MSHFSRTSLFKLGITLALSGVVAAQATPAAADCLPTSRSTFFIETQDLVQSSNTHLNYSHSAGNGNVVCSETYWVRQSGRVRGVFHCQWSQPGMLRFEVTSSSHVYPPKDIEVCQGYATVLNIFPSSVGSPVASVSGHSITGRVTTPYGAGIRNAIVQYLDYNTGLTRTATTSSFGYYSFEGVTGLSNGVVTISSKRYRFEPFRIFNPSGYTPLLGLSDIDFVGLE